MNGDAARTIYLVESGSIRITMQSAMGKECLLRIRTAGEIFGETALLGSGIRLDTATAREPSVVLEMAMECFLHALQKRALCEEFMLDLIRRTVEEEKRIADLVTEPSRRRLGKMLLLMARKTGTQTGHGLRIGLRLSHDEWAALVGTTRPRVSTFLGDFRRQRLIGLCGDRHLIVDEPRLHRFLGEP